MRCSQLAGARSGRRSGTDVPSFVYRALRDIALGGGYDLALSPQRTRLDECRVVIFTNGRRVAYVFVTLHREGIIARIWVRLLLSGQSVSGGSVGFGRTHAYDTQEA